MNDLMKRLYHIEKECGDGKSTQFSDKSVDEFTRLKKGVARQLQQVREEIKERDEAVQNKKAQEKYIIELSARIRQLLRGAEQDAMKMREIHQKAALKKKKGKEEEIAHRAEVVDVVFKHIEECKNLEKRRYQEEQTETRSALFSGAKLGGKKKGGKGGKAGAFGGGAAGAAAGGGGGGGGYSDPTQTDLPEIDVAEGLAQIKKTDAEIDADLDQISVGVHNLHNIAVSMQEELKVQNAIVDEITNKVDDTTAHLNKLNRKMKDTLVKARKGSNLIIDFILLIVILGIGAFVYNSVRKK